MDCPCPEYAKCKRVNMIPFCECKEDAPVGVIDCLGVVVSGSLSILSDGEWFLLIPLDSANDSTRSESPSKPDWSPCDGYDRLRCWVPQNPVSYHSLKDGFSSLEDSSTQKAPAHARLRFRPTVGLNLRATPSTVISGFKGAGLFGKKERRPIPETPQNEILKEERPLIPPS
ncbi:hypothetical protein PRIPAC_96188 [Pristionchus pacificus]|uniref:Uncharacterized protein n=1 Tax=Pristionchus pacificus TaxID=54126 RepID=A0A454XWJ8_PRIPA|nr:hypothetical protein PRIPAC_96188 [Pristionchus pacificus]|eukprot:PDM66119.1 hypothetical protein PRIPAC_45344 [Pristionchus pacificus]